MKVKPHRLLLCGLTALALTLSPAGVASATPEPTSTTSDSPSIEGRITDAAGSPLVGAWVYCSNDWANGPTYADTTDADGRYRISNIRPGPSYVVAFEPPGTTLLQYIPGKRVVWEATQYEITADTHLVADDVRLATGTITGRFTDPDGTPVAADVAAIITGDRSWNHPHARTNPSGQYTIPVFPGKYSLAFTYGTNTTQYAPGKTRQGAATEVSVAAGEKVTVDEVALPSGDLAGRLTMHDGAPAAGASVALTMIGNSTASSTTTAAADGSYRFERALAVSYLVELKDATGLQWQWAGNTIDRSGAVTVNVTAGQATTLDEQFLPTGSIVVRRAPQSTEEAASVCVRLYHAGASERRECGTDDGTVELKNVPVAAGYVAQVERDANEYTTVELRDIAVTAGATTSPEYALQPVSRITVAPIDAVTKKPVADVCVYAFPANRPTELTAMGYCSATATESTVYLPAGTYILYASPWDKVHGAQWVGPNGGTGSTDEAARVTVGVGETVAAPPIVLDGTGQVSGTVTDAGTGQPVKNACIDGTWVNEGTCGGVRTGADGRYTLPRLGPYAWKLRFTAPGYAHQWNGGKVTSRDARAVTVTAGQTATADQQLVPGVVVSGRVTDAGGHPIGGTLVFAINAGTGALAAAAAASGSRYSPGPTSDGRFELRLLPQQQVRFGFQSDYDSLSPMYWAGGAGDFAHTTTVDIDNQPLTIDLVMPG